MICKYNIGCSMSNRTNPFSNDCGPRIPVSGPAAEPVVIVIEGSGSGGVGATSCSEVIGCLVPGSVPAGALAPGALPGGVTLRSSQLVGVVPQSNLPPVPAPIWDPIANTLTFNVAGVATPVSLGSLDDEGTALAIVGGVLELRNKAGVLLGSTPVTGASPAPNLSLDRTVPSTLTIRVQGGTSVSLTCVEIEALFPLSANAVITGTPAFLSDDCSSHSIQSVGQWIVDNFDLLTAAPGTLTFTQNPTTGVVTPSLNGVPQAPIPAPLSSPGGSLTFTQDPTTGVVTPSLNGVAQPPIPGPLPLPTPSVSTTGVLSIGGQTIQLVRMVSTLGADMPYWLFPAI